MYKHLSQFVCVCFFVLSFASPCAAQSTADHYPYKHLNPSWDWGSSDIDKPDFSQFPVPNPDDPKCVGWSGHIITSNLDLSGRDLRNARIHLLGGTLRNIKFDGANLEGAVFCEVQLINCSFRGTNLKHARLMPSPDCDITDAILGGDVAHLSEKQIRSTWNFKNKDFSNTRFSGCVFPDVEYDTSFNFSNTVFGGIHSIFIGHGTRPYPCCYSYGHDPQFEVPIETTIPRNIKFEDFSWEQLPKGIRYTSDQVFRTREFKQKSLHGITVVGIDFTDCDFSGFTLGLFVGCNFQNANFKDAVRLSHGVNSVEDAGIFGFRSCKNITKEQIEQTRFWKERDVRGIVLGQMNLDEWDFSNKDLSYASFERSSANNATFGNATLYSTRLSVMTIEQIKQTLSWNAKRIAYCELYRINFDDCDLSGFDFSGTKFIGCSFKNANLTGADIDFSFGLVILCEGLTEKQIRSLKGFKEEWLLSKE